MTGGVEIPEVLMGSVLLVFGKKIFWLSVGIIGFFAGMSLAPRLFPQSSDLIVFALALGLGLAGAILAVAAQWVAILGTGFLGMGYLFFSFFPTDTLETFFIGGVIGALMMALVFDWALIVLSSLMGAVLVSQHLAFSESARMLIFVFLAAAGMIIQAAFFLREPPVDREDERRNVSGRRS